MTTWYRDEAQLVRINRITKQWTLNDWGDFARSFRNRFPSMLPVRSQTEQDQAYLAEVAKKSARAKWVKLNVGDRVYFKEGDAYQEAFVVGKLNQKQSPSKTWTVCVEWHSKDGLRKQWVDAGLVYRRLNESCAA